MAWLARVFRRQSAPQIAYSPQAEEMRIWQARARLFMLLLVALTFAACALPTPSPASPPIPQSPNPTIAQSPNLQSPIPAAPTPIPGATLATLDTAAQLRLVELPRRDPVRLTEQLDPAIDAVPLLAAPQTYIVGDQEAFWVHNSDAKHNREIEAELVYQTDVANVWVEAGQEFDRSRIARALDRFSGVAYPALVGAFGRESNPGIDGDPRLHILHTAQMGAGVAGYFYSADKYTKAVNPFSNEKEIFFINLNWLNGLRDYTTYETVLAHEFQHMIHWNQDRGEDLWLNEGLSEYAQEVAQYAADTGFAFAFLADPDLTLTTWSPNPGANAPHYGASYLFVAYLAQRFGDDFLSRLVAEPRNGANGVDAVLATVPATSPSTTCLPTGWSPTGSMTRTRWKRMESTAIAPSTCRMPTRRPRTRHCPWRR
jgi:immune inhibitor A